MFVVDNLALSKPECENNRHQGKENTESKFSDSSVASSTTSQSSTMFSINKEEYESLKNIGLSLVNHF